MADIIKGPWKGSPEPSEMSEEDEEALKNGQIAIQALVSSLTCDIVDALAFQGIDNSNNLDYTKDLALIAEAIRSLVLKNLNAWHPIQDICEELFEWTNDGKLLTKPGVNIIFKEK